MRGVGGPLVVATPANAVMLLRDVGEGQELGKGARNGERFPQLQRLQRLVEGREIGLGECPHALDRIEQPGPLLGLQGLAEEGA